ncbi:hypothetical protein [Lentzea sp. HUAS12]|uniref:hypothetical protein n=1 Tax=Lentzea sp. HUAS12 TaxID=2951806 RepID=UPI00209FAEAB|nr:hypothetical protein [Lentzea sp. HUAS12]USX54995.1 hypothetical protein ND450_13090 [Lentzea sp. HUAS12]
MPHAQAYQRGREDASRVGAGPVVREPVTAPVPVASRTPTGAQVSRTTRVLGTRRPGKR